MENFYKITKAEASLIGYFEYAQNKAFNPFVGEQVDGNYLISETMYDLLNGSDEFKKISFGGKTTITKGNLDTKITNL